MQALINANPGKLHLAPIIACAILLATSLNCQGRALPAANTEIDNLILQLDAVRFEEREYATKQLVAIGQTAIRPLAYHFLEATPESAWRIKRILQQIGTGASDEETSLKAIGILIVLDHRLDGELRGLLDMWRDNRSKRAIDHLISKGATTDLTLVQRQLFLQQLSGQLRNFTEINPDGQNSKHSYQLKKSNDKLTKTALKKDIESVVDGSFKDVQRFVFNRLPDSSGDSKSEYLSENPFELKVFGGFVSDRKNGLTFLEFGRGWKGTSDDLLRIKDIHSLYAIRFVDQALSKKDVAALSDVSNVRHIGIVKSDSGKQQLSQLQLPDSIVSAEIGGHKVDRAAVKWLASHSLTNLILNECQITESAPREFERLSKLQTLDLRRMKIGRSFFEQLNELPALERIYLSVCKFSPEDYRNFVADIAGNRNTKKPISIVFNPVSFLGVQARQTGPTAANWSCRIQMVVPDSGADKAGLKANDIIESVNGSPIEKFEELRMHITQHEVGEQMELQVLRGSKRLKLTATLGTNPNAVSR